MVFCGMSQNVYESESISANYFIQKKAQFLEVFHPGMLFHRKCFSPGNAVAVHVSIFLSNIFTFVSKYFL